MNLRKKFLNLGKILLSKYIITISTKNIKINLIIPFSVNKYNNK